MYLYSASVTSVLISDEIDEMGDNKVVLYQFIQFGSQCDM